jgi:uroporphyrin-III C-methyltransferase
MTVHASAFGIYPTGIAPKPGHIALVGAGPGAADLLTLRAVERMRAADVIYYDRLVAAEVLAMAGPRARRIFVGKEVGAHSWPQDRINAAITAAALSGLHVVRLKSGDPSIFGRAGEEIAAARAFGIAVEIIPGITAASAGAASLCRPLTERGQTERLVLATATCRPGDAWSGLDGMLQPGTMLALYMAMHRLGDVQSALRSAGLCDGHAVLIAAHIGTPRETSLDTTVSRLCADVQLHGIGSPAIIYVSVPKTGVAVTSNTQVHAATGL